MLFRAQCVALICCEIVLSRPSTSRLQLAWARMSEVGRIAYHSMAPADTGVVHGNGGLIATSTPLGA